MPGSPSLVGRAPGSRRRPHSAFPRGNGSSNLPPGATFLLRAAGAAAAGALCIPPACPPLARVRVCRPAGRRPKPGDAGTMLAACEADRGAPALESRFSRRPGAAPASLLPQNPRAFSACAVPRQKKGPRGRFGLFFRPKAGAVRHGNGAGSGSWMSASRAPQSTLPHWAGRPERPAAWPRRGRGVAASNKSIMPAAMRGQSNMAFRVRRCAGCAAPRDFGPRPRARDPPASPFWSSHSSTARVLPVPSS